MLVCLTVDIFFTVSFSIVRYYQAHRLRDQILVKQKKINWPTDECSPGSNFVSFTHYVNKRFLIIS